MCWYGNRQFEHLQSALDESKQKLRPDHHRIGRPHLIGLKGMAVRPQVLKHGRIAQHSVSKAFVISFTAGSNLPGECYILSHDSNQWPRGRTTDTTVDGE